MFKVELFRNIMQITKQESGFKKEDKWPRRVLEPSRACISSLALTEVKNNDKPSTSINTSQKLLLFWRKPAVYWPLLITDMKG